VWILWCSLSCDLVDEPLVTVGAGERSLTCVSPEVLGEVHLYPEALPALSTGMGLLPPLGIPLCAVLAMAFPTGLLSCSDGFLVLQLSSLQHRPSPHSLQPV